jgi:hypothetical protein
VPSRSRVRSPAALVKITGDSYRLREAERAQNARKAPDGALCQPRRVLSRIARFLMTANIWIVDPARVRVRGANEHFDSADDRGTLNGCRVTE